MAYFFLGLAFLGAVAPYSFLGQFLLAPGANPAGFLAQVWQSPVSSYLGLNVLVAGLVTMIFIFGEGRKRKMKGLWLPLLATLVVGVACGLPLFLYLRQLAMEKARAADESAALALPAPKR